MGATPGVSVAGIGVGGTWVGAAGIEVNVDATTVSNTLGVGAGVATPQAMTDRNKITIKRTFETVAFLIEFNSSLWIRNLLINSRPYYYIISTSQRYQWI
jgi:hypothetical protein